MPDENNKEYKNLVDLFAGVHQKIHYLGTDYMVIREDKFQNFIDFIMYLDVIIKQLQEATGLREVETTYSSKEVKEMMDKAKKTGKPVWGNKQKES